MTTKPTSYLGYTLVFIQFVCLGIIFLSGSFLSQNHYGFGLQLLGFLLGAWAIKSMRIKVNVIPTPRNDVNLITKGPYSFIRHPMYTAVLLVSWPTALYDSTYLSITAAVVLTVNLLVKLFYEETLLVKHYEAYRNYQKNTKRLIPFIF